MVLKNPNRQTSKILGEVTVLCSLVRDRMESGMLPLHNRLPKSLLSAMF